MEIKYLRCDYCGKEEPEEDFIKNGGATVVNEIAYNQAKKYLELCAVCNKEYKKKAKKWKEKETIFMEERDKDFKSIIK